jgi:hypothetical protein
MTLEFTITPFATAPEAMGVHLSEAVRAGTAAHDHMATAPSLFINAAGVANDIASATNPVNVITPAWDSLLQRIKLCTEHVDRISEVDQQPTTFCVI